MAKAKDTGTSSKPAVVLFLVPYPLHSAPSQRFRFEQYLHLLAEHGLSYRVQSYLQPATWQVLYRKGFFLHKTWGVISGMLRRYALLATMHRYQYVFIHREAAPLGPPLYLWLLAKVWRKKIVYDFDDAIWIKNHSVINKFPAAFKWYSTTTLLMKWSCRNACGNDYLRRYASLHNPQSVLLPTTVDTEKVHNRIRVRNENEIPVIGWTGTLTTVRYLEAIVPVLSELHQQFRFRTLVISDIPPAFSLPEMTHKPWRLETEIEDLLEIDIGLMPLETDRWSEGKCGLKVIQYMALGIVPIATFTGASAQIIQHGINGFICQHTNEWSLYLHQLLADPQLLRKMAALTRQRIVEHYSVKAQSGTFLRLFADA